MEHRIRALQQALFSEDRPAQGYLLTSPVARRYLLGFASTAGTGVILEDAAYFIVDFRYYEMAQKQIHGARIVLQENLCEQIRQICSRHRVDSLGVEEERLTLSEFAAFSKALSGIRLGDDAGLSKVLNRLRLIKDEDEIAAIAAAQALSEQAFSDLLGILRPGLSEKRIALELDYRMRGLGAEDVSFETIVAAGEHSASPHAHPSDYLVQEGDLITMDFGALLDGYHADMTRTIALGEPGEKKQHLYQTVLSAQLAALKVMAPGEEFSAVDRAARSIIDGAGYRGCFGHSLGHGVGVEIHEAPALAPRSKGVLKPGMVVSCEPGIYLEGMYGARIEDLVAITETGCRNLNQLTKELICL